MLDGRTVAEFLDNSLYITNNFLHLYWCFMMFNNRSPLLQWVLFWDEKVGGASLVGGGGAVSNIERVGIPDTWWPKTATGIRLSGRLYQNLLYCNFKNLYKNYEKVTNKDNSHTQPQGPASPCQHVCSHLRVAQV